MLNEIVYALEFVEMWVMLQQETPDDYVIATGETHTVREFVEKSFQCLNVPIRWEGKGQDEIGINSLNGKTIIKIDPNYYRPTEVDLLIGDATKAKKTLGWNPKVTFEELVEIMTKHDYDTLTSSTKEHAFTA